MVGFSPEIHIIGEVSGAYLNSAMSELSCNLPHSFRVYFYIFSTRFECIFTSSSLVSSVVQANGQSPMVVGGG